MRINVTFSPCEGSVYSGAIKPEGLAKLGKLAAQEIRAHAGPVGYGNALWIDLPVEEPRKISA